MRSRVLTLAMALLAAAVMALVDATPAWANDPNGQYGWTSVQASGGTLTVQAGHTYWTPPQDSSWATGAESTPPSGAPNPNQPYGCTYSAGGASATAALGVGGPEPGQWVFPDCRGPGVIDPMPPFWVSGATPATGKVQVDPVVVAERAAKQLGLASPAIEMAPPDGSPQLVGLASWLWINPDGWRAVSASATAGPVTTTATATPTKVVFDMGDGTSVSCDGPGTPYNPAAPNATTDCSYVWPDPGSFTVTATIYWSVTWSAVGAAGGGSLGLQAGPSTSVPVTVTESQAVNTPGSGSD